MTGGGEKPKLQANELPNTHGVWMGMHAWAMSATNRKSRLTQWSVQTCTCTMLGRISALLVFSLYSLGNPLSCLFKFVLFSLSLVFPPCCDFGRRCAVRLLCNQWIGLHSLVWQIHHGPNGRSMFACVRHRLATSHLAHHTMCRVLAVLCARLACQHKPAATGHVIGNPGALK